MYLILKDKAKQLRDQIFLILIYLNDQITQLFNNHKKQIIVFLVILLILLIFAIGGTPSDHGP